MVPQLADLREKILREFHCSRFAVHPSGTKVYYDLHRQYYWSGMKKHVRDCKTPTLLNVIIVVIELI